MNVAFGFTGKDGFVSKFLAQKTQIGVIGGIGIDTAAVEWFRTISVIVIGLTISTKATHDTLQSTAFEVWNTLHDGTGGFVASETGDGIAIVGILEGSRFGIQVGFAIDVLVHKVVVPLGVNIGKSGFGQDVPTGTTHIRNGILGALYRRGGSPVLQFSSGIVGTTGNVLFHLVQNLLIGTSFNGQIVPTVHATFNAAAGIDEFQHGFAVITFLYQCLDFFFETVITAGSIHFKQ
mmetsp:Transcript_19828/g.29801  ORF Transcript_19828/g.29801 Transcript_19828/m.29801 type:complete len:235 (+) Transcript_19828:1054-1758(+)